jgi:formate dehydrogenase subunit delta
MSGSIDRLVAMANDIANYFGSEPDRAAAIAGVANHLRRFWEPRMRNKIIAHLGAGGAGLSELAREGVSRLAQQSA